MIKKIEIVFVIPSLVAGGSERIMSFISQNIDSKKFNSKLLVAGYESETVYNVENVEVIYLNKSRILYAIPSFFLFFMKAKPDIVMSSMSYVNIAMAYLSYFFRKTKFVGREATIPSVDSLVRNTSENRKKKKFSLKNIFNINFYNTLDLIVCQSNDMANDMITYHNISESKIKIINNPISNNEPLIVNDKGQNNVMHFVTVGRLSKEKGHLRIIQLLPKLQFEFTYTIIGDGDEKENIFREAKKLGVFDKITHIPFTKNVHQFISKHDMFLQGSYVEGFPNALLESCMAGIPVIAFNVPGGTKEIIEHNVNGFLVETEKEYLDSLHKNIKWNPSDIRNSVFVKFNKERILNKYEDMFLQILN